MRVANRPARVRFRFPRGGAKRAVTDNLSSQFVYYLNLNSTHGKAGDCIACKKCEQACPQHLKISELMKDVSATFDNGPGLPTK